MTLVEGCDMTNTEKENILIELKQYCKDLGISESYANDCINKAIPKGCLKQIFHSIKEDLLNKEKEKSEDNKATDVIERFVKETNKLNLQNASEELEKIINKSKSTTSTLSL